MSKVSIKKIFKGEVMLDEAVESKNAQPALGGLGIY